MRIALRMCVSSNACSRLVHQGFNFDTSSESRFFGFSHLRRTQNRRVQLPSGFCEAALVSDPAGLDELFFFRAVFLCECLDFLRSDFATLV